MRTELVRRIGLFLASNIEAGIESVEEARAFVEQLDGTLAEELGFLRFVLECGDTGTKAMHEALGNGDPWRARSEGDGRTSNP